MHINNIIKKAKMGISQIENDDILKPPKPFKIMVLINYNKKDEDEEEDGDGTNIIIKDFVKIKKNQYQFQNIEQDITV
jgi:hypothetical protein